MCRLACCWQIFLLAGLVFLKSDVLCCLLLGGLVLVSSTVDMQQNLHICKAVMSLVGLSEGLLDSFKML